MASRLDNKKPSRLSRQLSAKKTPAKKVAPSTVTRKTAVETTHTQKQARFEARLSEDIKELIEKAAQATGKTLTEFVVGSASEAAIETLQKLSVITISAKYQRDFVELINNPPKPNSYLKESAELYWNSDSL